MSESTPLWFRFFQRLRQELPPTVRDTIIALVSGLAVFGWKVKTGNITWQLSWINVLEMLFPVTVVVTVLVSADAIKAARGLVREVKNQPVETVISSAVLDAHGQNVTRTTKSVIPYYRLRIIGLALSVIVACLAFSFFSWRLGGFVRQNTSQSLAPPVTSSTPSPIPSPELTQARPSSTEGFITTPMPSNGNSVIINSSPTPAASTSIPNPQHDTGTSLAGISGTGVTAKVKMMAVHNFGSPSLNIYIDIQNTSSTGTITNIGFFIKSNGKPSEGSKIDAPGEITRPGNYKFTTDDLAIDTAQFKAISAFTFLSRAGTSTSTSFHKGYVSGGIPPGQSARFLISGDAFLGDATVHQLERSAIVRFQGIGKDDLSDIAITDNGETLFSASDFSYRIFKK